MDIRITRFNCILPANFRLIQASAEKNLSFLSGELVPDRSSPFFPERSDEKIMREDVKAAVIAVQEMMNGYSESLLEDTDLYVANGVFIEDTGKQLQRVIDIYRQIEDNFPEEEKVRRLYQATPPLLALQTLTNSSMSFISQYAGIKGNNTTFGNTSQSAFHAIQKAAFALQSGTERVLVCASNCGGAVSYLTSQSFFEEKENWKESAAAACLFFETDLNAAAVCRITGMKMENHPEHSNALSQFIADEITHIVFSGAFTEEQYRADLNAFQSTGKQAFSYFPEYGNLGSANLIMSVIKGIELLQSNEESIIALVDRDVYGRESYIRIEK